MLLSHANCLVKAFTFWLAKLANAKELKSHLYPYHVGAILFRQVCLVLNCKCYSENRGAGGEILIEFTLEISVGLLTELASSYSWQEDITVIAVCIQKFLQPISQFIILHWLFVWYKMSFLWERFSLAIRLFISSLEKQIY